jgi:hypothetical protein
MRLGARPDTVAEWLALRLNLAPKPLADTHLAFLFARIVMAATQSGLFEALRESGGTAEEVAIMCGTDRQATSKVLDALLALDYLGFRNGHYELNKLSRKWLLADSPDTLVHKLAFQQIEWRWTENVDQWLQDGSAQDMHHALSPDEWRRYQWAMRDVATTPAKEVAWRIRLPKNATALLDIGGSHGFYSVELCRRYPALEAAILEVPEAIPTAAEILAREGMGPRVRHTPGNALDDDLGRGTYDAILVALLVHHFTEAGALWKMSPPMSPNVRSRSSGLRSGFNREAIAAFDLDAVLAASARLITLFVWPCSLPGSGEWSWRGRRYHPRAWQSRASGIAA